MRVFLFIAVFGVVALAAPVMKDPVIEPEEEDEELEMPGFGTRQESHDEKFIRSDANKDQKLTFDEFLHMELAYVEAKKEEFDSLDKNRDGILSREEYEEHYHGVQSKSAAIRAEYFSKVFDEFDDDLNLALSQDELERVLAERFLVRPRENFPKIFYKFDTDHSGGLDLHEYMNFDAKFPFQETDPIKAPRQNGPRNDVPIPADADMAAVAHVLAQSGAAPRAF